MGNIIIAYRNVLDEAGVTVTHSTEASADFAAENLQIWDPLEAFRTTVLNPGWAEFALPRAAPIDFAALMGCKVSAFRNLLLQATGYDTTWTRTGLDAPTEDGGRYVPDGSEAWSVVANGAGSHYLEQSVTLQDVLGGVIFSVFGLEYANNWVRLYLSSSSLGTHWANFNTSTNAIGTTSGTPNAGVVTGIATPGADAQRQYIRVSGNFSAAEAVTLRIYLLDTDQTESFTAGGEEAAIGGSQLEQSHAPTTTLPSDYYSTTTIPGATWGYGVGFSSNSAYHPWNLALNGDLTGYDSISTYYYDATYAQGGDFVRFDVYDALNADSQIDIGRAWAGPIWQPSNHNLDTFEFRPVPRFQRLQRVTGSAYVIAEQNVPNEWRVRIPYITEGEALADLHDLMLRLHGTTKPCIVILDPAETVYAHQGIIYGWIRDLRVQWAYNNTAGEHFYHLSFTMEEFR